jgi:hypothetical protein
MTYVHWAIGMAFYGTHVWASEALGGEPFSPFFYAAVLVALAAAEAAVKAVWRKRRKAGAETKPAKQLNLFEAA